MTSKITDECQRDVESVGFIIEVEDAMYRTK